MRRRRCPLIVVVQACASSPGSKYPLASLSYIAIRDNKSARKPCLMMAHPMRPSKRATMLLKPINGAVQPSSFHIRLSNTFAHNRTDSSHPTQKFKLRHYPPV